jgi:hypothetical protein
MNAGAGDFFINDGHPESVFDRIEFWMESGFLSLPHMSRNKTLEYTFLDIGGYPLRGNVTLNSNPLKALAKEVSNEMKGMSPYFDSFSENTSFQNGASEGIIGYL